MLLAKMLKKLKADGHRVLIFSQVRRKKNSRPPHPLCSIRFTTSDKSTAKVLSKQDMSKWHPLLAVANGSARKSEFVLMYTFGFIVDSGV